MVRLEKWLKRPTIIQAPASVTFRSLQQCGARSIQNHSKWFGIHPQAAQASHRPCKVQEFFRQAQLGNSTKLYEMCRLLLLQLYNCSGCRHRYTGAERNVNARRQDNGSVPQSYFVARHNCVRCCQLSTHRLPWRPQLASVQQKWLIYLNDSQIDWSVFKVWEDTASLCPSYCGLCMVEKRRQMLQRLAQTSVMVLADRLRLSDLYE